MQRYKVSVQTATYAMKGKELLRRNRISAEIERRTEDIGKYGCGYRIVFNDDTEETGIAILKRNGIRILNIKKEAVL